MSTLGYALILGATAYVRKRSSASVPTPEYPAITIVIPTFNEERFIAGKLRDIWRTRYPHDRMTVIVADAGSTDHTITLVKQAIDQSRQIRLVCTGKTEGKLGQAVEALQAAETDICVVTDADSTLACDCLPELVATLMEDDQSAIVGASIYPVTDLLEERIHWWLLNYLWWLEGEAFSAAMISAVCYAIHTKRIPHMSSGYSRDADDASLVQIAAAHGAAVRICPRAMAREHRVPQSRRELFNFRCRRGLFYLSSLLNKPSGSSMTSAFQLVRRIRLFHFLIAPNLVLLLGILGSWMIYNGNWVLVLMTLLSFMVPLVFTLSLSRRLRTPGCYWWTKSLAAIQLISLLWLSLLLISRAYVMSNARRSLSLAKPFP